MLEYPGNFDTSAFPAGRRIAVARVFGIGILVSFFLVACVCGMIIWGAQSRQVEPLVVSINRATGDWSMIKRSEAAPVEYTRQDMMQESVVGNFFQNWFLISDDADQNDDVWRADCPANECTGAETMAYGGRVCALACGGGAELYQSFVENVMPDYHSRAMAGETWHVIADTMEIRPVVPDAKQGGSTWMVRASVMSNINSVFNVVAFVRLGRMANAYPMTMGYYVVAFNAYRVG